MSFRSKSLPHLPRLAGLILIAAISACSKQTTPGSSASAATAPAPAAEKTASKTKVWVQYPDAQAPLSATASLGKQLFFDASLSASGKMSCATCHSPDHAYGPPNDLAVQLGGPAMDQAGTRTVPSLRYMDFTPKFTRHLYLPSTEGVEDEGPGGGFTHDGSVDTLAKQAAIPLLAANEMANLTAAAFTERLQHSAYAQQFQALFGAQVFEDPALSLDQAGKALEAFETEDASFHPYTSKFDSVVSGQAQFTEQELRGYRAFKNPNKANCAKCHIDTVGGGGRPAQFTDFEFEAIGVPRNANIPANKNPRYFDLGICGPARKDLSKETSYCGMFKTPTLRNVASRTVFFHNGRFSTLEDVMHFYVERDSKPEKWYPRVHGKLQQYDDLPASYRVNVDHVNAPFNRDKSAPPALTEDEIKDLIVFLHTLTDGYSKNSPHS